MPKQGYTVKYIDVEKNKSKMTEMLKYSKGENAVPTIVYEDGTVKVGYGGS